MDVVPSILNNRQQYVTINGQQSNLLPVLSGIPQGSILGSLLFIIFINDLPLTINFSHLFLFTDDTKCLFPIHSPTESLNLQRDLQAIGAWSNQWSLAFNESKCAHVRFFPNSNSMHTHTTLTTCLSPFLIPIKILESSCLVTSPGMTIIVSLLQKHTNPLVSLEELLSPILYLQKGSYTFPLFVLN